MKKKLFIAAAVLIGLLLSVYGYLQFRQFSSYRTPIHANADNIIKINADELIKIFIKEYGFNFNKKIKKATGQDTVKSLSTGIYLPANLFIYQLSNLPQATWFCTIPMHDVSDFKIYMQQKYSFTIKDSAGINFGISPDEKIRFVCNEKFAAFSFTQNKADVTESLTDILLERKIIDKKGPLIKNLKSNTAVLSFFSKKINGSLSFKGNDLIIEAALSSLNPQFIPAKNNSLPVNEKNFITASLNLNFSNGLLKKEYQLKNYTLETDSVLKYYNGFTAFEAGESIASSDTAISYEYDDNFEMKEVIKINKVQVPALQLVISAHEGLWNYLKTSSFINADNRVNKNIFPLYPVKASYQNNLLVFSTQVNNRPQPALQKADDFMSLQINFAKQDTGLLGNITAPYTKNIETLKLIGKTNKNEAATINGTLHFNKPAIQALIDMTKLF